MDFDFDEIPLGQIMGQFILGGNQFFGPQGPGFMPPQGPPFGPGGQPPFGPPPGGPGFGPPGGGPGFGPPAGGGPGSGPPQGAPPTFTPPKPGKQPGIAPYAVEPGAIRPCTFRYVYIWLRNGRSFWAYLIFVGRDSAAGWRWNGFRWVYFGIDLDRIDAFVCY